MQRYLHIFKKIPACLCILGMAWFLLPLLRGGFGLGAGFGFAICLLGFLLIQYVPKLTAKGGRRAIAVRSLVVFYILGLCWAGYLTGAMVSVSVQTPPSNQNVIVLGAQVYSAERMGVTLTNRINAAYDYLTENPQVSRIVTGGQGTDEPCPEALTEKNALVRLGIDESRIYMEDSSRNTRQNFRYAKQIAEENNLGNEFVIVSQSFHLWRAKKLAESVGLTVYPLAAKTDPLLLLEYYGRELLSLTKYHFEAYILKL